MAKSGTPRAGGGDVDISGAPNSITFLGGDSGCSGGSCNLDFTIAALASGNVLFDWSYLTTDVDGPAFEPWGFLLNGIFTQVSNSVGANAQSGSGSFAVLAGDIFGFRLDCTDCALGPANITVSNFSAPDIIPEPATLALLGLGLAGLGFLRRRIA